MLPLRSVLQRQIRYKTRFPKCSLLGHTTTLRSERSFGRPIHQSASPNSMESEINELITFYTDRDPNDWYMPPQGFDEQLESKYGNLVRRARTTELDPLADTPEGALALVILLDQIPRNIFRQSGESFASDAKALEITTKAIARNFDKQLGEHFPTQRFLFYMPMMHAESLLGQVAARALIDTFMRELPADFKYKDALANSLTFAQQHLECVLKLGRFPKRNEPLGRTTTPEEAKFLETHPYGF